MTMEAPLFPPLPSFLPYSPAPKDLSAKLRTSLPGTSLDSTLLPGSLEPPPGDKPQCSVT